MKKRNVELIVTTLACLLPAVAGLILYDKLPDRFPVHFNANGEPDGYAGRLFGVLGMPLILAAVNLPVHFALRTDPKKQNMSPALKLVSYWFAPVISIVMNGVILAYAMGAKISITTVVLLFLGILFIVIGNYLPKTKQAYTMGIRLPWTLASEENWNRTHRLAGFLWVIGGAATVLLALLRVMSIWVPLGILLVMSIVPTVYSYVLYRKGI